MWKHSLWPETLEIKTRFLLKNLEMNHYPSKAPFLSFPTHPSMHQLTESDRMTPCAARGPKCTFVSLENVLLRHHWNHGIEQRIFWGAYWLWRCGPLNPCRYWKGSIDTWRRNSIRTESPATSRRKLNQSTGCVGCYMTSVMPRVWMKKK